MSPRRRDAWIAQTAATTQLDATLGVLETAGIPVLAVKGVVTARLLYEDPADRWLGDVDLRIRRRDFERAHCVIRGSFQLLAATSPHENIVFDGGGIQVDVETRIGPPGLAALTVDELLERSSWIAIGGARVRVPEVTDHALVLAVNVFKDKLAAAAPWALEDCARIVRHPDFRAADFCDRARAAAIQEVTYVVARFFEELGHAEWAALRRALGPSAPRPLYDRLLRGALRQPSSAACRLLSRIASDRPRAWADALLAAGRVEAWRRWEGDRAVIRTPRPPRP